MIILTPDNSVTQDIKFIPRKYSATTIEMTNQDENKSFTLSPTFVKEAYYLKTSIVFTGASKLTEGVFYRFVVKDGSAVVYRDIVFATSQNISTYSIQTNSSGQDIYDEHETENEYIVFDE